MVARAERAHVLTTPFGGTRRAGHDEHDAYVARCRDRLFDLTNRFRIGTLITRAPDGLLHGRPMTLALLDSSSEELGFLTVTDSDVVRDVGFDPMVSVAFQDGRHQIGWSGRAHVDHERYRVSSAWRPELARWFPEGPDDPHLVLLVVRAIRAEYWSASVATRALTVLGAASAPSALGEAHPDPARHGLVLFGDEGTLGEW